jgi:hypothetical protein
MMALMPCNKDNAMLDYELMTQYITEIDAKDHNNITFTLCVNDDDLYELTCCYKRRLSGFLNTDSQTIFGCRVELWINDRVYHSSMLHYGGQLALDEERLVKLHDALLSVDYKRSEAKNAAHYGYIDTVSKLMKERDALGGNK